MVPKNLQLNICSTGTLFMNIGAIICLFLLKLTININGKIVRTTKVNNSVNFLSVVVFVVVCDKSRHCCVNCKFDNMVARIC